MVMLNGHITIKDWILGYPVLLGGSSPLVSRLYHVIPLVINEISRFHLLTTGVITYPLVICYIAIEHGHRNSEFSQ